MNHEERLQRRRELCRQQRDRETNDERQERLRRQREYMRAALTDQQRETIFQQRRNLIRQPSTSLRHCHVFICHNSPSLFVSQRKHGYVRQYTVPRINIHLRISTGTVPYLYAGVKS